MTTNAILTTAPIATLTSELHLKNMPASQKSPLQPAADDPSEAFDSAENAERWQVVLARNAAHDGQFVYAVSTTGVYCRP